MTKNQGPDTSAFIQFLTFGVRFKQMKSGSYKSQIILTDDEREIILDEEGPFSNKSALHVATLWMMKKITRFVLDIFKADRKDAKITN